MTAWEIVIMLALAATLAAVLIISDQHSDALSSAPTIWCEYSAEFDTSNAGVLYRHLETHKGSEMICTAHNTGWLTCRR